MLSKDQLIAFEKRIASRYEAGEIRAPVHLSSGNEEQLIKLFERIWPDDWVLSTWRSHYHALLHGIPADELMRQILAGKSMTVNSLEHKFYSSSIAGGILPIAVGLGLALKRKQATPRVWCFVGDMVAQMGIFYEAVKYAWNFKLPVNFVVEDNGKSVQTDTAEAWGGADVDIYSWGNVFYYRYKLGYPHHGVGTWVAF